MASITTRNGQRCTAVPKVANVLLASNSSSTSLSSASSTSTSISTSSTSSTSSSTATSTSATSTSVSSISTTSSLLLSSSSSTSISIPTDPQATPVDNPAQPDSATQISSETSSSTLSTTSTTIANTPAVFANPAIGQSVDQPSSSTDQPTDQTTPTLPASIVSTVNTASLGTDNTGVLTDTAPAPSQLDQAQSTDVLATGGAASAQLGQSGDSTITTGLDGSTATPTAAGTQSTGSSLQTETNKGGLSTTQQQVTGNAITTQQTIAIAAGVVGAVIIISSMAFMIWVWRKRKMQGRRSTLLTPLSPDTTFRDREKGTYLIDRSSLGPTPMSEKLWAVVGMKYKRLRGKVNNIVARSNSPSPSVNLDRGNSQFGPPDGAHSRNNSNAGIIGGPPTTKGRFVDWWSRLAEDGNSNWRLRRESKADPINNESYAAVPRSTDNNNARRKPSQPDFLSLLNMDDRQLEQAARGRDSVRGSQRRSISMGNEQHFLGGLDLNFDDPFSDVNAIGNNTAKAKPIIVSAANNPFSDANAIKAPSAAANGGLTTYVHNVRRSRGHSVNGGGISRQTSNSGTRMNSVMHSLYRESNASVSTVGTRRNKFRSDPFDLDRPDLLSANSSFDATVRDPRVSRGSKGPPMPVPVPNTPKQAHVRTESFSSKYSSGVSMSMSQWSDPGPDVGPAAARYTPTPDNGIARRDSDTRRSGGSQGSVGKAL